MFFIYHIVGSLYLKHFSTSILSQNKSILFRIYLFIISDAILSCWKLVN